MNRWAIMDDNGIIYEGTEEEMRQIWRSGFSGYEGALEGDLRLIEIHEVEK